MTIGFITGYKSKLGFTPSKNATLVPKVPRHRTVFSLLSNSKIVVIFKFFIVPCAFSCCPDQLVSMDSCCSTLWKSSDQLLLSLWTCMIAES